MREYRGVETSDGPNVFVYEGGKRIGRLNPAYHLRNHSPDGFAWGYAGSGPAQLSLAILVDALRNDTKKIDPNLWPDKAKTEGERTACRLYQRFKSDIIQHLPMDSDFSIEESFVKEWIARQS